MKWWIKWTDLSPNFFRTNLIVYVNPNPHSLRHTSVVATLDAVPEKHQSSKLTKKVRRVSNDLLLCSDLCPIQSDCAQSQTEREKTPHTHRFTWVKKILTFFKHLSTSNEISHLSHQIRTISAYPGQRVNKKGIKFKKFTTPPFDEWE